MEQAWPSVRASLGLHWYFFLWGVMDDGSNRKVDFCARNLAFCARTADFCGHGMGAFRSRRTRIGPVCRFESGMRRNFLNSLLNNDQSIVKWNLKN